MMPVGGAFSARSMCFHWVCEAVLSLIFQEWHSLSVFQVPTLYNFSGAFCSLLNSLAPSVCSFPLPSLSVRMPGFSFSLTLSPHLPLQTNIKPWLQSRPHSWLLSSDLLQEPTSGTSGHTLTHIRMLEYLFSHNFLPPCVPSARVSLKAFSLSFHSHWHWLLLMLVLPVCTNHLPLSFLVSASPTSP